MEVLIPTLVLSLLVGAFFFAGLGIRILMRKEGGFRGTCASQSPFLKSSLGDCQVCGKPVDEAGCREEKSAVNG